MHRLVWGSGRSAIDDFQNGRYGWGLFNSAMAVGDVFLVKALATAAAKGIGKLAFRKGAELAAGKTAAKKALKGALLNEGTRASELADAALLKKLGQRGFTIDQSAEIQRYLESRKANAATFLEKDLLLRPMPGRLKYWKSIYTMYRRKSG